MKSSDEPGDRRSANSEADITRRAAHAVADPPEDGEPPSTSGGPFRVARTAFAPGRAGILL